MPVARTNPSATERSRRVWDPEQAERPKAEPEADRNLRRVSRPLWIVALCVLGVALHAARTALIPLIFATLLALMLSGFVEGVRRWRIPRAVSATLVLLALSVAAGLAVDALAGPAQQWVENAPRVLRVVERRVRPARIVVQRFNDLAVRAAAVAGAPAAAAQIPAAAAPSVPVTAIDLVSETGWLGAELVTVVVLTLLLLSAGPPTLAHMMAALGNNWQAVHVLRTIDAVRIEVGRYYGTLALINVGLGCATALAMWLLGMPNPWLWGALAALLNFIPYLGSAITLGVVGIVALVSFDSLPHALAVPATYLALATLEGQVVEPILFGRRLQLNPIVVFIALWLGGWMWGIAGVAVALPVLLAMKVAAVRSGTNAALQVLSPAIGSLEEPEERRVQVAGVLGAPRRA
ncbi:MAG: AI-2E family transporter [Proteobacteria bacterium]|nr:AI-2E family transporter [Pseudomonadota bacterium]